MVLSTPTHFNFTPSKVILKKKKNANTPQKIKKLKESKKCGLRDANAFQVYNIRGNFKVRAQSKRLISTLKERNI